MAAARRLGYEDGGEEERGGGRRPRVYSVKALGRLMLVVAMCALRFVLPSRQYVFSFNFYNR